MLRQAGGIEVGWQHCSRPMALRHADGRFCCCNKQGDGLNVEKVQYLGEVHIDGKELTKKDIMKSRTRQVSHMDQSQP